MRKLVFSLTMIVLLLPLSGLATAQDAVEIEFWGGWTAGDGDIMQQMVDQFNSEHDGIQVNLTRQQWSPLFDAFVVSGSAEEAPDILAMHPQEMPQFVELELLDPLDDVFAESDVLNLDDYLDAAVQPNIYKGALYGIPLDIHMHGLYYNLDLFEEAGIEAPPVTGEEFLEVARMLTIDENGLHPGDDGFDPENVVQYGVNMHTNHHAFFQWWGLYRQQGGQFLNDEGTECVWDYDKATAAWQWLQDLVYTHHVAPQGQTDYPADFFSGRTAMLIDGPWQMVAMAQQAEENGFRWATAKYPQVFDEQYAMWGSEHILTLPHYADPDKRDEALVFLSWLAANSAAWAESGQLPAAIAVMESDEFQNMYGRAAFIEMMPYAQIFPNTPKYNEIFASNAPTPMMVMAQNIMLEQAEPRAEAEKACDEITFILSFE